MRHPGMMIHSIFRYKLHLNPSPLLLHSLNETLIRLLPFLTPIFHLDIFLPLLRNNIPAHHDHTSRPLRHARNTQLRPAGHVDVWDTVVFGEDGDVADHVHGGDVGGEDDDADGEGRA